MKITAQEEYGLRCLLQLARADRAAGLTVREIASREGLSSAYVEKLLRLLAKGELIHSVRGIHGGYLLNKAPEEIRLSDVVTALGSIPSIEEICDRHTGNKDNCVHMDNCSIRSAWSSLTDAIQGFMSKVYISDMVSTEKQMDSKLKQRILTSFDVSFDTRTIKKASSDE